jgi:predicted nucleic acid-binding protein
VPVVVDASVTLASVLPDQGTSYTNAVETLLAADYGIAPGIWPLEVANGLRSAERRQGVDEAQVARFVRAIAAFDIRVVPTSFDQAGHAILALARAQDLTAYDAAYVELALREGLPLATLDEAMRAAAGRLGIPLAAT